MEHNNFKPGQNVEVKHFWASGEEAWFGGYRFLEFRQIRGRMSCVVQPTQGVFQDCKFNYNPEKVREIDSANKDSAI